MATPKYDLNKIKFFAGNPLWERAVDLYERGRIKQFKDNEGSFSATVFGGNRYDVWVSAEKFDVGDCTCFLGQKDTLCKHLVALAIHAVARGKSLTAKDTAMRSAPEWSGALGSLSASELRSVQEAISAGMKCIGAYNGPSRMWFAYQGSLMEGCNRLSAVFSELPVSEQTAKLVVKTLLRLDEKLCRGGVDDSDGAVGSFIEESVSMLTQYARLDPTCIRAFETLNGRETCFDWQTPLVESFRTGRENMV